MLILFTQPALSANSALETLDLALAAASLNQPVKLVFLAAGVGLLQAKSNQQQLSLASAANSLAATSKPLGKSFLARLKALSLFGVDEIFIVVAHQEQAKQEETTNLAVSPDLGMKITQLNPADIRQLMSEQQVFVG